MGGTARRSVRLWALLLIVLLAWLIVYPLLLVARDAFVGEHGWTLDVWRAFLARPTEWRALWGSCWISLATVVLSALVGVPLAWLVTRTPVPGRRILGLLFALPAVLPPLVGVVAFLFLYGESGFAAHFVRFLTGSTEAPWRLEGAGAILLVHVYSMYVYFYLFTRAGLASLDPAQLEAAQSLGAGRARTLVKVVLPHLRPALAGAALITFMTSLASFSAPYLFGGGTRVMTTQIVATRLNGDYALAMAETLALTALALGALAAIRLFDADDAPGGAGKGLGPLPAAAASRGRRTLLGLVAWPLALVVLLPHLTLLVVSFVPRGTWTTEAVPPIYSLRNYTTLVADPVRFRPLVNSLWMAALATAAAVAVALLAGHLAVRRRAPGRRWIETLLALPWAVPGTVFAIALATTFSVRAPLAGRWVLVGTLWILPLTYLVRNLPIAGRAILGGWRRLDPALDEAAASLGAGAARTLRRVTLPLLRPALVAGASLAFVTAFGDFVTSIVLYTYDTRPVSLEILGSLRQSDVGVASAYGVVLMAVSGLVFWLGREPGGAA